MLPITVNKVFGRAAELTKLLSLDRFPRSGISNVAARFASSLNSGILENILQENQERDLVNFPRPQRAELPGQVRFGFIPVEWFDFFYQKTGVTGPYVIALGLATFLVSKEVYILEHNFFSGISLAATGVVGVKTIGSHVAVFADKKIEIIERQFKELHLNNIRQYEEAISHEKREQWRAEGQFLLLDAKRKTVAMQLEAEYRERVMEAYNKVKQRLEQELEQQRVIRTLAQKHMVEWVRSEVGQSVASSSFDQRFIKKCIEELLSIAPQGGDKLKPGGSGDRSFKL